VFTECILVKKPEYDEGDDDLGWDEEESEWLLKAELRGFPDHEDDEGFQLYLTVRDDTTKRFLETSPVKLDYTLHTEKAKRRLVLWERDSQQRETMGEREMLCNRLNTEQERQTQICKLFLQPALLSIIIFDNRVADMEIIQSNGMPLLILALHERLPHDVVFEAAARLRILPTVCHESQDCDKMLHRYFSDFRNSLVWYDGNIPLQDQMITPHRTFYSIKRLLQDVGVYEFDKKSGIATYSIPVNVCILNSTYSLEVVGRPLNYNVHFRFVKKQENYECTSIALRVLFPPGKQRRGGLNVFRETELYAALEQGEQLAVDKYNDANFEETGTWLKPITVHVFELSNTITVCYETMRKWWREWKRPSVYLPDEIITECTTSRFVLSHTKQQYQTLLDVGSHPVFPDQQENRMLLKTQSSTIPLLGFLRDLGFAGMSTKESESFRRAVFFNIHDLSV
jgi:hypothetical protein